MVEEFGRRFLAGLRQRDPALDAENLASRRRLPLGRRAFRMDDALAGRHPIHIAGHNGLRGAKAIAVHDFAFEQIGDRCEPDMRMGPHVEPLADGKFGWPHPVPEDERPDHLPLRRWQRAPHVEPAQIAHARQDHNVERLTGPAVAGNRVFGRAPAHGASSIRFRSEWPLHDIGAALLFSPPAKMRQSS